MSAPEYFFRVYVAPDMAVEDKLQRVREFLAKRKLLFSCGFAVEKCFEFSTKIGEFDAAKAAVQYREEVYQKTKVILNIRKGQKIV